MCIFTEREKAILINLGNKEAKDVATSLGMNINTLNVHLHKIRKKREEAKKFLRETDRFQKELYPRRKGE